LYYPNEGETQREKDARKKMMQQWILNNGEIGLRSTKEVPFYGIESQIMGQSTTDVAH
jgi:hypothetical protein